MAARNEFRFALAQWSDACRRHMGISLYQYSEAELGEEPEVYAFASQLGIDARIVWTGKVVHVWRFKCKTTDQRLMCKLRWGGSPIWETLQSNRDDH